MKNRQGQVRRVILLTCFFCLVFSSVSHATIIVYDSLTTVEHTAVLKTRTKGFLTPKGGKRVQFLLKNRLLCKTLTGFDGFGYCEFKPQKPGLFRITVKTESEKAQGLLYVATPEDEVFFIEIESMAPEPLSFILNREDLKQARDALKKLYRKFLVVYTGSSMGFSEIKALLKEIDLPEGPVLEYYDSLFSDLKKTGLNLFGILCTEALCYEAKDYFKKVISFEETENAEKIDEWEDLPKATER